MTVANACPPLNLKAMLDALIAGNPVKLQLLDNGYTYDASTLTNYSDITGGGGTALGAAITLSGVTTTGGVLDCAQPVNVTGLSGGDHVQQLVVFADAGGGDGPVLAWADENADGTPIDYTSDGSTKAVGFPTPSRLVSI